METTPFTYSALAGLPRMSFCSTATVKPGEFAGTSAESSTAMGFEARFVTAATVIAI